MWYGVCTDEYKGKNKCKNFTTTNEDSYLNFNYIQGLKERSEDYMGVVKEMNE